MCFLRQNKISKTDVTIPHGQANKDIEPFLMYQAFLCLQGSFESFV